jgi:hypothetical protein
MFVVALPPIAVWATINGDWDPVGAISFAILWLLFLALLRWHYRAKSKSVRDDHPAGVGPVERR